MWFKPDDVGNSPKFKWMVVSHVNLDQNRCLSITMASVQSIYR